MPQLQLKHTSNHQHQFIKYKTMKTVTNLLKRLQTQLIKYLKLTCVMYKLLQKNDSSLETSGKIA
jgi:hypothetical protein